MARNSLLSAVCLALLAAAACDAAPTAAADGALSADEAQTVAAAWDEVAAASLASFGAPSFALSPGGEASRTTVTAAFERERACPLGGTSTVVGQRVATHDPAAGTGSVQVTAVRTDAACVVPARRGEEATLTITGSPNVQLAAQQSWANRQPGVRTATQQGSFTWARSTGQSGTCAVALTSTWDPSTRAYTVNGTFCGRTISITRTRTA